MTPWLVLAPAGLGAIALIAGLASTIGRSLVRSVALAGAALALATVGAASSLSSWRSVEPDVASIAMVSGGAFVAWVIVAARPARDIAALVGVAISSLLLFASGGWIAPALIFWACASLATATVQRDGLWWVALAVSDVALLVAVIPEAIAEDAWRWPGAPGGLAGGAIAAAIVVRSGALLHVGPWRLTGAPAVALAPLALTSAFVLAARAGGGPDPWFGAALLAFASLLAAWMLWRGPTIVVLGTWVSAVFIALAVTHPDVTVEASWAAALAAGLVALWPFAHGRGAVSRAAALALVPPSPGFAAIAAVTAAAIVRASAAGGDRLAWAAVAALLPLVLASAVALTARVARTARSDDFEPASVIATWTLLSLTLVAGIFVTRIPGVAAGALSDAPLLVSAALLGGLGALRTGARLDATEAAPPTGDVVLVRVTDMALVVASAVIGGAAAAGVAWLVVAGLRVGFL